MEIGILKGHFEEAHRAVDSYPFDVIIGSFHCTRNDDMYRYDFAHADGPAELEDFYTYMYECLKEFQDFDIAGHFSILDRYIGTLYDYGAVEDQIDEILKLLINNGKGLEINTSSFKYGTGTWLPRRSILSRYLNLGGEILTFGSDAHDPFYYQYHFNDAVEFARSIGFRHYCKIHPRKPEFYKLPKHQSNKKHFRSPARGKMRSIHESVFYLVFTYTYFLLIFLLTGSSAVC